MLLFVSDSNYPLECVSCGNLLSEDGFVHPRRNIDSFVLILVDQGTLHINIHGENHDIRDNQFVLLISNQDHYGYKPSKGFLSYYWVHFYVRQEEYELYNDNKAKQFLHGWKSNSTGFPSKYSNLFILPEVGETSRVQKARVLFNQLLDFAKRDHYTLTYRCHYALSLLTLELSWEYMVSAFSEEIPMSIIRIIDWIRLNYNQPMTVQEIANHFNYNPNYLSRVFKKHTGYALKDFVTHTRISVSKNILISNMLPIKTVGSMCGVYDEKYFMKLFKKLEGMTPSEYRKAFTLKKVNNK